MALTAREVQQTAIFQNELSDTQHYTGYRSSRFVTCTVSPNEDAQGEPTPNAFMVSDMGQALIKSELLVPSKDRQDTFELRAPQKHEALPTILEASQPTTHIDSHWFIVRVAESAPKTVRSIFEYAIFPRENRNKEVGWEHIKEHLKATPKSLPVARRMADFHLIVRLADLFDLESALRVCDAVANGTEVDTDVIDILQSATGAIR
eukprot:Selendium_serpulae@DN6453_c1_g2_i1.p1